MQKVRKWFDDFNQVQNAPSKVEYIVALAILLIAAFTFCFMKDFRLTVTQSLDFLDCLFQGKVLQYYSEINKLALSGYYGSDWPQTLLASANYSIINYATIGLFCLPVYVIDKLISATIPFIVYEFVVKLAYIILVIYMTKVICDIVKELTTEEHARQWIPICFLTSPVLLYSSIMISHMDIFSIVFLLLGILYMVKDNRRMELAFFMLAVAYKPFVILGIIPMVLLKEKRIFYLIRDMFVILLGVLVQGIVYKFDPGYGETQKFMSDTYDFVGRFFASGFSFERNAYESSASYFIIAFVLICMLAYAIREAKWIYVFALPALVMGTFVLFVKWHPNWMLLLVPYMVLMLVYTYDIRIVCILECLFSTLLIVVSSFGWGGFYDIEIINGGVITQLLGLAANGKYDIARVLTRKLEGIPAAIYGSLLCGVIVGIMGVYVLDCIKTRNGASYNSETRRWERCAIWCRVLPAVGFMAYAFLTCIKR